jgi:hypothetical protein
MAKAKHYGCLVKELPDSQREEAAALAIHINPANRPAVEKINEVLGPERCAAPTGVSFLAVLTSKYWGPGGVELTVGFMEQTAADLRDRILSHMNAWGDFSNVKFRWTQTSPQVRITRSGDGYWSYLGTDVLRIPAREATMCLQGFTMRTSEAEYKRVVRHEVGHTLGFPHEHMRQALINRLDRNKTIEYFRRFQGWDEETTVQQVLTPLEESSLLNAPSADQTSIMCYQLPASITKDGKPIPGGGDINEYDKKYTASIYPKVGDKPQPPVVPGWPAVLVLSDGDGKVLAKYRKE